MLKKIIKFFTKDLWHKTKKELSAKDLYFIRPLRIIMLAAIDFKKDNISIRASALTLFSMLSVVPVLAVGFGIAKGFGFEKTLNDQIASFFNDDSQKQVVEWMIQFANNMLVNTKGGIIAGIGIVVLLWSVMNLLGSIENAFNTIWQVSKARTLFRKFGDYLAIMLVGPILIIISSGFTVFMENSTAYSTVLAFFGSFILSIFPYIVIWLLFTITYLVMPNTNVKPSSAIIAGIIAGSIFQVLQWGYVIFQIRLSNYGAIYGTFAALPLFILWLQLSWIIVLFGAEISHSIQNIQRFEYEMQSFEISNYDKKTLALYITWFIVKNFEDGKKPLSSIELSNELEIPIRTVSEILQNLNDSNIIMQTVTGDNEEKSYHPAIDIAKIDMKFVLERIEKNGIDKLDTDKSKILKNIANAQNQFMIALQNCESNKLLKDI